MRIDHNKKEATHHGSYGFPIAVYDNYLDEYPLGTINWHWHDEIQFCVVIKGKVRFHVLNEVHEIEQGQGIFINSGFLHMASPGSKDGGYICVDVQPKMLASFPGSVLEENYVRPFVGSSQLITVLLERDGAWKSYIINELIEMQAIHKNKGFGYEIDIYAKLILVWKLLLEHCATHIDAKTPAVREDYQRMKKILDYIEENYPEKMRLAEIAHMVFLSESECCRFFKRNTNTTLFEYITAFRIMKGIELLNTTDMSISRISTEVGFSSASHFTESFRVKTGTTPREFRKMHCNLEA